MLNWVLVPSNWIHWMYVPLSITAEASPSSSLAVCMGGGGGGDTIGCETEILYQKPTSVWFSVHCSPAKVLNDFCVEGSFSVWLWNHMINLCENACCEFWEVELSKEWKLQKKKKEKKELCFGISCWNCVLVIMFDFKRWNYCVEFFAVKNTVGFSECWVHRKGASSFIWKGFSGASWFIQQVGQGFWGGRGGQLARGMITC